MRIDSAFRKGSLALCKMVMTGIQVESLGSMPSLVLEKRSLRRSVQSKLKGLDVATKQTESGCPVNLWAWVSFQGGKSFIG